MPWHRIAGAEGDEHGNAGLKPVRQIPRRDIHFGFPIENTENRRLFHSASSLAS
jgi:hypothetical protein